MDREMLVAPMSTWLRSRGDGSWAEEVTESEKSQNEEESSLAMNVIL